jgi:Ala-tRNA(Pro) deacylase
MTAATWVQKELAGSPHLGVHHSETFTAQELAQCEHVSGHRVAKVVILMADGRPIELILPASRQVDLDWVRSLLGAREVRLASEDELTGLFADCEPGALPPLRHGANMDVLMDGFLRVAGDILLPGATHRDAYRMRFDDWFALVNPRVELVTGGSFDELD